MSKRLTEPVKQLYTYECTQCGYQWNPRTPNPIKCPKCQSREWASSERKAGVA